MVLKARKPRHCDIPANFMQGWKTVWTRRKPLFLFPLIILRLKPPSAYLPTCRPASDVTIPKNKDAFLPHIHATGEKRKGAGNGDMTETHTHTRTHNPHVADKPTPNFKGSEGESSQKSRKSRKNPGS